MAACLMLCLVNLFAGQNKDKMKCCVITGRALDPIQRKGTHRSFKRVSYLFRFALNRAP
jgi:hypothetical protein